MASAKHFIAVDVFLVSFATCRFLLSTLPAFLIVFQGPVLTAGQKYSIQM